MTLRGKTRLFDFAIVSNSLVAEDTYKAILSASGLADVLEPGQFVNVRVPGDATHILRIPLSFSHADCAHETLELI